MRHKDTEYSFLKWWIHFDVWQKFKNKIKLKKKKLSDFLMNYTSDVLNKMSPLNFLIPIQDMNSLFDYCSVHIE